MLGLSELYLMKFLKLLFFISCLTVAFVPSSNAQKDLASTLDTLTIGTDDYFQTYVWYIKDHMYSNQGINVDSLMDELIKECIKFDNPKFQATTMYYKAQLLGDKEDYSSALDLLQKALDISQEISYHILSATILNYIGIITAYASGDHYETGIPFIERSNSISLEHNLEVQLLPNYYYLGYLYCAAYQAHPELQETEKFQNFLLKSEQAFDKGIKLAEARNDQNWTYNILSQKANLYLNQKKYTQTIDLATNILKTAKANERLIDEFRLHIILAKGKFGLGRKAFAYQHLDTAIQIIIDLDLQKDLIDVYGVKYEFALKDGDYKTALEYYENKATLKDSLWTKEKKLAFDELTVSYDAEKKAIENQQLKNEKALLSTRNRWISLAAFIFLLGLLGVGYFFIRNEKQNILIKQQKEELEKLDEIKTQFFANVTHELRTPLTLIIGPLKQLMKDKTLDENTLLKLNTIAQNGAQLKTLVEELLDLSRYDANKLILVKKPVHFLSFLKTWAARFELEAKDKGIDFKMEYQLPIDLSLNLDVKKLEKIVSNLLINAFKFSQKGDSIIFKISELNNQIQIQVEDTGKGIHEKDLPHIFKRYFQSNQTDSQLLGGLGIGLAMAKELTQLMDGQLSADSTLGQGSIFTLFFPKEKIIIPDEIEVSSSYNPVPANTIVPLSKQSKQHKHTILIVEDNPDMSAYIQDLMSPLAQTLVARNGLEALDLLENDNHDIQMIISDVMMPEMDGITLLEKLKASEKWQLIPTVMLTARTDLSVKIKALTIGVDDYLIKPFEPEELIARVNSSLQNIKLRQTPDTSPATTLATELPKIESANLKWLKNLETIAFEKITQPHFNTVHLADELAISERQLSRKLKKATGLAPGAYLKEIRLQKARQLLENQAFVTVAEISYHIGFNTPQYFSTIYKERFGKLPSEYLNN